MKTKFGISSSIGKRKENRSRFDGSKKETEPDLNNDINKVPENKSRNSCVLTKWIIKPVSRILIKLTMELDKK